MLGSRFIQEEARKGVCGRSGGGEITAVVPKWKDRKTWSEVPSVEKI